MQSRLPGNVLIVAGPRNFFDREVISDALIDAIIDLDISKIITGDAPGVDTITAELCTQSSMEYERYFADWDKYGKSAGPRRNWNMAISATHLLAFYKQPYGTPGTCNMIYFAERHDLIVKIFNI